MAFRDPPSFLAAEGVEHTARNDRLTILTAPHTPGPDPLSARSGVLVAPAGAMGEVTLPGSETVRVAPGMFLLQGAIDATQGAYIAVNDGPVDRLITTTQDVSQFRRVAVVVGLLDAEEAGLEPTPTLDGEGNPVLDGDGNPVLGYGIDTNLTDLYLVEGDLSPAAPGPNPDVTGFEAYTVLGWINVPPAGQPFTVTPNSGARVGSRTGILPVLTGDTEDGSHLFAYRHHPVNGLEMWDGDSWQAPPFLEVTAARLRLTSTSDANPGATAHALQIGPTSGLNLVADNNEVQARNAGAPAALGLTRPALGTKTEQWDLHATGTPDAALVTKGYVREELSRTEATTLRLTATADATPTSTGHALQIGRTGDPNLRLDTNEIIAVADVGGYAALHLTNADLAGESWNLAATSTPGAALVTKAYVAEAVGDTAWTSFSPAVGWSPVNADGGVRYRIKGGLFWLRFAATHAAFGAGINLCTIAEQYRPAIDWTIIGVWQDTYVEIIVHEDSGIVETGAIGGGKGGIYLGGAWPIG